MRRLRHSLAVLGAGFEVVPRQEKVQTGPPLVLERKETHGTLFADGQDAVSGLEVAVIKDWK